MAEELERMRESWLKRKPGIKGTDAELDGGGRPKRCVI
jgi:hypothetical protein